MSPPGLNPKLLLRKFRESYPTDEGIRATHAGTRADAIFEAKLKAKVEELCRYYRISETDVKRAQFMGKTYTVIGALTSSTALAVSHVDCRSYRLRPGSKHNLRFL